MITDDDEDGQAVAASVMGSSSIVTAAFAIGIDFATVTVFSDAATAVAAAAATDDVATVTVATDTALTLQSSSIATMVDPNIRIPYPLAVKKQDKNLNSLRFYDEGIALEFDGEIKSSKCAAAKDFQTVLDLDKIIRDVEAFGAKKVSLVYRLFLPTVDERNSLYEYKLVLDGIGCNDSLVVVEATAAFNHADYEVINLVHFKVRTYRIAVLMLFALCRLFSNQKITRFLTLVKPSMKTALEWDKFEYYIVQNLGFVLNKSLSQTSFCIPKCAVIFDRSHVQDSILQDCYDDDNVSFDEYDENGYLRFLIKAKQITLKNLKDRDQEHKHFKSTNIQDTYEDFYDAKDEYDDEAKLGLQEAIEELAKLENGDCCSIESDGSSEESGSIASNDDDDCSIASDVNVKQWFINALKDIEVHGYVPLDGDIKYVTDALTIIDYFKRLQFMQVSNKLFFANAIVVTSCCC